MERVQIRKWVEERGVKEVWIWGYHGGVLDLWVSNTHGKPNPLIPATPRNRMGTTPKTSKWSGRLNSPLCP